mgnify:FL=1
MYRVGIQAQALKIWTEIWKLAGEQWPPRDLPSAWRVYEFLKDALTERGVSESQAIAFADDFFYREQSWGDLAHMGNHEQAIEDLSAALIDSELVALEGE